MPAVAPFARKTRGRRAYSVFDQNRGDALLSYHPCDRSVKATFRRPEGRPAAPPARARSGEMTGQGSGPDGGPTEPVPLSDGPNRPGHSGYMSITLPNGESFNGPYARVGRAAAAGPPFDIDFSVVDWGQSAD